MTPPWLQTLQDALDLEYAKGPRFATLATVDAQHRPRARTVVLRHLADDGTLTVTSDARSRKNAHLRASPMAELVIYLPSLRQQFRLAGSARVVGADNSTGAREQAWKRLSDESRATFAGPAPGHPRPACDDHFPQELAAEAPIPESFELIVLSPDEVDHLVLTQRPNRRTRWREAAAWEPENLNP